MRFLMLTGLLLISAVAFGHSGGTDASGCHNDHKRGGYHCH
ncbi:MAG: YHYH domain-containing protein [Sphingobacteriia bacterium]|nr:YHYH domain-containing protein [Sphingobacteriia bacterium]